MSTFNCRLIRCTLYSILYGLLISRSYFLCGKRSYGQDGSRFLGERSTIVHIFFNAVLKVPSGQIGSAWEWHHWINLVKDINHYVFWFFISFLNIWKDFKVLSRFMQKWIQPPARLDHSLHRILSSYLLAHFIWWKKSGKVLHYFGLDCGMLDNIQNENLKNRLMIF